MSSVTDWEERARRAELQVVRLMAAGRALIEAAAQDTAYVDVAADIWPAFCEAFDPAVTPPEEGQQWQTVGRLMDRLAGFPRDARLEFHVKPGDCLKLLSVYPGRPGVADLECHVDIGREKAR